MPTAPIPAKQCNQCGAENDPIVSNCKQCKSSLPRYDIGAVPEETLLSQCSFWLAQLEALKDYATYSAAKSADQLSRQPLLGRLAKLTSSGPSLSEVVGTTDKYVRAITVRAADSPSLASHIREFQERQKDALAAINRNSKGAPWKYIAGIAGAIGVSILLLSFVGVMARMENQGITKETLRLEALIEKAEQALAKGDKDTAKFFVGQIKWTHDKSDDRVKLWDEKRQTLLEVIGN